MRPTYREICKNLFDGPDTRGTMRMFVSVIAASLMTTPVLAQQVTVPRFEVVSIRPAPVDPEMLSRLMTLGGRCGLPGVDRSGNRVTVAVTMLCGLIRVAYNVADYQVSGLPADLARGDAANWFHIEARAEDGTTPTVDDVRLMLQTMLAERFRLRVHREPREMPVYALVTTDERNIAPCTSSNAGAFYAPGHLVSCSPPLPMARVAQMLTREAGRPVIDQTGLAAGRAFELYWLPDGAPLQADSLPSLFTAIQDAGLRLDPARSPVDTVVVDHAERPSPN